MAQGKRRLLTAFQRATLRAGLEHPECICELPHRLNGCARAEFVLCLDRLGLVRVTQWTGGREVGVITDKGRRAYQIGYVPAEEPA